MSERLKEHAWKACVQQCTRGSNPRLSAIARKGFFAKRAKNPFLLVFRCKIVTLPSKEQFPSFSVLSITPATTLPTDIWSEQCHVRQGFHISIMEMTFLCILLTIRRAL